MLKYVLLLAQYQLDAFYELNWSILLEHNCSIIKSPV